MLKNPLLTRRAALSGLAAGCIVSQAQRVFAAGSSADRKRPPSLIDVHHHLFTASMVTALSGKIPPALLPGPERSLAEMDEGGTAVAILSYPNSDIIELPVAALAPLIQKANDEAAEVVARNPTRYGWFASLPMPYVDQSLEELTRIFEQLHADGILLLTSYASHWLGDSAFAPLLEQLNRRHALVSVHPASPLCCSTLLPDLNAAVIEYETDTARTIASLMFSGALDRYPDIRWIFSHAGGTMPSLIERFRTVTRSSPKVAGQFTHEVDAYLRGLYYDTAQAANPVTIGALLQIVPSSQLLFGTDFPYRHAGEQSDALRALKLPAGDLAAILQGNAERLCPRLAGRTVAEHR